MENIKKFSLTLVLTVLIVLFSGVTATAGEEAGEQIINPVADVSIGANGIGWSPKVSYARMELTVSGPDGIFISKVFDSGASPYLGLSDNNGKYFIDGSYTYELRAIPNYEGKIRTDNEKSEGIPWEQPLVQTGYFTVMGGSIVPPSTGPEPGISKPLDQIIADDLIVQMSACIGMDCINGENFGFDTVRLKENNLRIRFYDTSNSAGFPTNDWQLTANDSANGGANKFSIDDIDSGRTPFTIAAGTRANAIYVDASGRVGFGTATPSEDLHIWYGDTPTIRLAQSGSGWAPQTWDISGNEANFFIRDVTNGSKLPFRIQPSAPTNSFFIKSDGKIGIGTQSPSFPFHLLTDSSTNASLVCERSGGAQNFISATSTYGQFGTVSNHPVRILVNTTARVKFNAGSPFIEVLKDSSGTVGATCDGDSWLDTSTREAKENINGLTDEEAMQALYGLTPVKYNYKTNKEEERLGFIAEDVPELVAMNGRKNLSAMDIVAVLTKVVQEQQKSLKDQQEAISQLKKRIAELEKK